MITNDLTTAAKDLFIPYAERMIIENQLDADICDFHLNDLSSGLPLYVDADTTLNVLASNCYRLLARTLPRYELATPDRLWRYFLDNPGTVSVAKDYVRLGPTPVRGLKQWKIPQTPMGDPTGAAGHVRRSLTPDGTWRSRSPMPATTYRTTSHPWAGCSTRRRP